MYCLPVDVRDVLRPGTSASPSGGASEMDSDYLIGFIEEAENEVNARLAVRYTVPFPDDQVPKVVSSITRDFAAYYADLSYRGQVGYQSENEPILMRRKGAQTLLDQIVKGDADIGGAASTSAGNTPAPRRGAGYARNGYGGRLFDPDPTRFDARPAADPYFTGPGW